MKRRLLKTASCLFLAIIVNVLNSWRLINSFDNNLTARTHFGGLKNRASWDMDIEKRLSDRDAREKMYLAIYTEGWNDEVSITKVEVRKLTLNEPWVSKIGIRPDKRLFIANISVPGIEQQVILYGNSMSRTGWGGRVMFRTNVGWPMRSLSSGYSGIWIGAVNTAGNWEKRCAWELPNKLHKLFPSTPQLILPYDVLWLGFTINTIFYAAILWILWLSPFTARRMIRRRRGHCIKCAYDLRETSGGCPECGWGREAEA